MISPLFSAQFEANGLSVPLLSLEVFKFGDLNGLLVLSLGHLPGFELSWLHDSERGHWPCPRLGLGHSHLRWRPLSFLSFAGRNLDVCERLSQQVLLVAVLAGVKHRSR